MEVTIVLRAPIQAKSGVCNDAVEVRTGSTLEHIKMERETTAGCRNDRGGG